MLSPDKAPFCDQVKAYMDLHGVTQTGFARRCKASASTIAAILRGDAVAGHVIRRVEAVIDGREFESEDAKLDATIELMIKTIVADSIKTGRVAGVGNTAYQKWRKLADAEDNAAYAEEMLRQYAAAETDESERLKFLMELCVIAKTPVQSERK